VDLKEEHCYPFFVMEAMGRQWPVARVALSTDDEEIIDQSWIEYRGASFRCSIVRLNLIDLPD